MFRTVFLCTVIQVLALRGAEQVAPLIQDQSADDAPVVKPSKVHNDSSFTELSVEPGDSSESPEADPLKAALPKKESTPLELPKCSNGTLQLESGTYEVTELHKILEPCNVSSNGATLLLSVPLLFSKTARFEGKLFVKALGSLEGPCFAFKEDAFIQSSAEMHFGDCHNVAKSEAGSTGGAIHVRGNLTVTGNLSIHNCSARLGGGIFVNHSFKHLGGNTGISGSSSENGGGIFVNHNFKHLGGNTEISGSSAKENGGGIYVRDNFTNSGGEIHISGSSAKEYGGGIYVEKSFTNSVGKIQISGSSAKRGGGIAVAHNFTNSGGDIEISGSSAKRGGGIYVRDNFTNSGGEIEISGSSAERNGGGIYARANFITSGGSLSVSNSSAKDFGGGLYVLRNVVFANATASFSQCHAQLEGGGILTLGNVILTNASLMFELATAGDRSAALQAKHLEQTGGDMTVYNSSASSEVISVAAWVIDGGTFHIQDCKVDSFLMAAHQGARLNATEFVVSTSSGAGMLLSSGEVTMSSGIFNQTSSPQLRAKVVKVTRLNVTGSEASISWASGISANESTVHDMDCDDSLGGYNRSDGIGCTKCDPGSVFVKNVTEKTIANRSAVQHCVPCPDGARICNATAIEMLPGMMLQRHNISRAWRCPNSLACEGGNVSSNASTEMCAEGYEDVGCAKCTNDCARSNSNVFICLKCAKGTWWKVKDYFLFFASDAVIFIISAAGVVSAGRQNKNSTVYLNQLMAFAAVTAPALVALRNSATFEHQLERLQQIFTFISFPVQAGDAGESATTVSTGCILRYLGLEPTLVLSQVLSSSVYVVLTLCLALKSGPRVALVVGINCFLPKFCSAFGAYLICYRMEPAPLGQAHCLAGANPFLGMTIAVLAIILCFAVGPGSWIRMTQDKSLKDEPQMGFFTIVLVASFGLHASQAPYTKDQWNQIELGLLVMALLVVILTTMCLANEIHWAHSDEVQVTLIVVITVIVAIAGGLQSFLLIRELILERFPQPVNTPEPMEPIEPTEGGEDGEVSKG